MLDAAFMLQPDQDGIRRRSSSLSALNCEVEVEEVRVVLVAETVEVGADVDAEEAKRFHLSMTASRDKKGNTQPLPLNEHSSRRCVADTGRTQSGVSLSQVRSMYRSPSLDG